MREQRNERNDGEKVSIVECTVENVTNKEAWWWPKILKGIGK